MSKKAVLLELDETQHADWKKRASEVDLTLSAWIRMKCSEISLTLPKPKEEMKAMSVNEYSAKHIHTAASNRHTCLCESCMEYRRMNAIPLGGFTK